MPGAAEEAGSPVVGLGEEHHAQPAQAGPAPHKGRTVASLRVRQRVSELGALALQKLQEQDELAEQLKGRLRWQQRELRVRLEQLQRGSERMRNDSQGSSMSSERSDSDRG